MSLTSKVGEVVVKRPGRARVFERFGIDYCCGAKLPLADACSAHGIDSQLVLAASQCGA